MAHVRVWPWKIATGALALLLILFFAGDNWNSLSGSLLLELPYASVGNGSSSIAVSLGGCADCALSLAESDGFICEADDTWRNRQKRFIEQQPKQQTLPVIVDRNFWQMNYEPDFSCDHEVRIGKPGDSGKWVCNPFQIQKHYNATPAEECIIYSVGSRNEFGYEEAMHEFLPDCKIFTFDHTVDNPQPPPYVTFLKWGVGGKDEPPLFTVDTIMRKLNHTRVEVFKLDVEGFEYETVMPMVESKTFNGVRQLQIELHNFGPPLSPGVMKPTDADQMRRFFMNMRDQGWVIYHKEPNIQYSGGDCIEYGFLRLSWNVTALMAEARKHWCVSGWSGYPPTCYSWGPA